jgi:NitT/TauT family transport system substrate-binding protein
MAGLVLGGASAGTAHAQTRRIPITIAGAPGGLLHWFPVYVARGRRFFEEEGIELDWANLDSGTAQMAAIMGGSCQVGPMSIEHVILASSQGADLVCCAGLFDVYPYAIVLTNAAVARAGITPEMPLDERIRKLRGLTIGTSGPGGSSDIFIRNILRVRGLDPDTTIRIQPVGNPGAMLAALSRGVVDGISMSAPVDTIAEARGFGRNVIDPFVEPLPELRDVPYSGLLARRSYIQRNPEVIAAAVRAVTKAIRFAHEEPEATVAAVRPYMLNADPHVLDTMIEKYRRGCARTPLVNRARFDNAVRWVNIGRPTPLMTTMEQAVYMTAAEAAVASIMPRGA